MIKKGKNRDYNYSSKMNKVISIVHNPTIPNDNI